MAAGHLNRLIIEAPPRHGKSQLASIYLPAWYLATFPEHEVILASATDELAADFSAAARDVLAEHGRSRFGVGVRDRVGSRHRWAVDGGGSLRSAGVGGSIMGRGANLLIIDDYLKNHQQSMSEGRRQAIHAWYHSTSSTRLTHDGAVVIIATRWHRDDLIGRLLAEQEEGGERWHVIRMPALADENDPLGRRPGEALWPERFDAAWLDRKRAQYVAGGYEWMWDALYQQNPPDVLDAEWPAAYFGESMWFDEWPAGETVRLRVVALDPSLGEGDKADDSAYVMLMLDVNGVMWVEADLARRDTRAMVAAGIEWQRRFRPDAFAVEVNGFQRLLAEDFRAASAAAGWSLPLYSVTNHVAKRTRIRMLTPYLAGGALRFKRNSPGTKKLVEQLRGFPFTRHDDGPDALEMAVRTARHLLDEAAPGPDALEDGWMVA